MSQGNSAMQRVFLRPMTLWYVTCYRRWRLL